MSTTQLITGDDTDFTVDLVDENDEPVPVNGATSVKVALISMDRTRVLVPAITADSGYTSANAAVGAANWAGGKIVVPLAGTLTAPITDVYLATEVEVIDGAGAKTTYLGTVPVEVIKGTIA